jgi:hypothetical protein
MPEKNEQEKAASTAPAPPETMFEQGAGGCSSPGCNCPNYSGSGNTCANCGHNYATHW